MAKKRERLELQQETNCQFQTPFQEQEVRRSEKWSHGVAYGEARERLELQYEETNNSRHNFKRRKCVGANNGRSVGRSVKP